jgi:hypothetical protein
MGPWPAAFFLVAFAAAWTASSHAQSLEINRHAAIHDVARGRTVVFGGYDEADRRDEIWMLALADSARWALATPVGAGPTARFGHSASFDSVNGRMVSFGGTDGNPLDEVWTLSLSQPPAWTQLFPAGPGPRARYYHSAIVDPLRERLLIFGGGTATERFNDVWALSLGDTLHWDSLRVSGTPPSARQTHTAIYDARRDRMLVFGGGAVLGNNDLWELTLSDTVWRRITPSGTLPPARSGHTAIYDAQGDRMIVFGGLGANQTLGDVWQLALSNPPTWSPIAPTGAAPRARAYHSAVYDPARGMLVLGGFPPDSEHTWMLGLGPAPAWSPLRPVVSVSANSLVLQPITVGDTAAVTFTIADAGLETLDVTAISLPASDLRVSAPAPFALDWQESVVESLILAGSQPRQSVDTLVIDSSDPLTPRRTVALVLDVRALDFETRVLGEPVEAPLGAPLIVVVTPRPGVRIERGTLFYRDAGVPVAFESRPLTALSTDFIAAIPGDAVTERGVEYYIEVENSGHVARHPATAPQAPYVQAVAPPTSIRAVPRPGSQTGFLQGRDCEVEVTLPLGAGFEGGQLHFRRGGEQIFAQTDLGVVPASRTEIVVRALIPADYVTARGVEFWVAVQTHTREITYPAKTPAETPGTIRTTVDQLAEPATHAGGRFRMVTVPLDFGDEVERTLAEALADDLGSYDPVRWRSFRWLPGSLETVEYSSNTSSWFLLQPSRAYWLITRDAHRIDVEPLLAISTSTDRDFVRTLEPGWNQFGNPFPFPVAWSDVARDTSVVGDPVRFDSGLGMVGDYADQPPVVLEPFEGYFIENTGVAPTTLSVPPRESARLTETSLRASPNEPELLWKLALRARTEGALDGANLLGLADGASNEHDALDRREPPAPPGPWVQLAFADRAWRDKPGLYRRDVRASGGEGHTWEIEVRSGVAAEPVSVEWTSAALPSDLVVRLLDREQGNSVDLAPASATKYELLSLGPERAYRLAIVAGTRDYVERSGREAAGVPDRLALAPGSPNPFRIATRIRFGLPRAVPVTLEVFDVTGQRVATLLDRAPREAGHHALIWDGRTSGGSPAPSGVYLLRVAAGSQVATRRLVLAR